jgi:hypothetical protein
LLKFALHENLFRWGWFCSEVFWLILFMRVPVEECDAVNFPLPGPNCVGWEDRNIQGLNFLSHLHATKSLICTGLALCLRLWHRKKDWVLLSFVFR